LNERYVSTEFVSADISLDFNVVIESGLARHETTPTKSGEDFMIDDILLSILLLHLQSHISSFPSQFSLFIMPWRCPVSLLLFSRAFAARTQQTARRRTFLLGYKILSRGPFGRRTGYAKSSILLTP
jgi:hypothetical protein